MSKSTGMFGTTEAVESFKLFVQSIHKIACQLNLDHSFSQSFYRLNGKVYPGGITFELNVDNQNCLIFLTFAYSSQDVFSTFRDFRKNNGKAIRTGPWGQAKRLFQTVRELA